MRLAVHLVCVIFFGAVLASPPEDCSFALGEWIFKECSHRVNEERFQNAKLERGICEVVQDQMERIVDHFGNQYAHELDLSFSRDICPRLYKSPYRERGEKGMRSQIEFAIARNTRDRNVLGVQLESWAKRWIQQAARDQDADLVEYVDVGDLQARIAEYTSGKDAAKGKEEL